MLNKLLLILLLSAGIVNAQPLDCELYFSPNAFNAYNGDTSIVEQMVSEINKSSDIKIMSYVLTSANIVDALKKALTRGSQVAIIVDRTQVNNTELVELKSSGAEIYIDKKYRIMHHKVILLDGVRFITGSYNLSYSAQAYNAENTLVCKSEAMVRKYLGVFEVIKSTSEKY